jgi:hypothetical protein
MNADASASVSSCNIVVSSRRISSAPSPPLNTSTSSSRADWSRASVVKPFVSSLVGSHKASRGGPPTSGDRHEPATVNGPELHHSSQGTLPPHARQDPTTGPNAGRVHAELSRLRLTNRLAPRRARELPSAKLSGQAGRALSAQAACTADTKRHWRCSGGDGNTRSEVRDESWSPWSERATVRSVAVVVVVIGEPLTVVGLESVGRSNRRGTRGYSAA